MNILVLGGNGFIGTHVVDSLIAHGHTVTVYDRKEERYRAPLPQVSYEVGVFEDTFKISEAMQGIDAIFHFISTNVPSTSNLDPIADVQSNLVGTLKLLELMRDRGPKKIIFLSSGGTVYGNAKTLPISEEHLLSPISSYGVTKVAIEKYLFMYQEIWGLESTILRVSNPYGPRQGHVGIQGLIATFLNKLQKGEPLTVWGDGSVIRDYLYIEDLAELCVKTLESRNTGVFNAGSGHGTSINRIIKTIHEVTKHQPEVIYQENRAFDVKETYLDVKKVENIFGWKATTRLKAGIQSHWDWLQSPVAK